jgi:hypothetical protein
MLFMDVAYITALSALAGSVVGGLTTGITTWLSLRSQARAGVLTAELHRRQDLFRDFILAASKAYGDALVSSEPQVHELVGLYAMVSRMRILCSPETITGADKVLRVTIDTYLAANKTVRELRDLIQTGAAIDPLKDFSEAARQELRAFARL